ncbi:hypothetical protein ETAA8_53860 [Anatilimnocola aggregata]|uniref:Uncharacterized protein n=1 Tax=Anatilimnocola aggregata TaxID=2528021 RepID=A0A517YJ62_9BACT|nr:hypothetical protein ETAA8_53860 [Anatilimnocola aggregata]
MLRVSPRHHRSGWSICLRTLGTLLMVGAFATANVGYPVWEPATSKSGESFPCQSSKCGCRTAEQCRSGCCCHTKEQRIAWALERGVNPARVAVLTEKEKTLYSHPSRRTKTVKVCCSTSTKSCANCCSSTTPNSACCGDAEQPGHLDFVLAIAAQKCTGTGMEWIQAGFFAPSPLPVTLAILVPQAPVGDFGVLTHREPIPGHLLRPA